MQNRTVKQIQKRTPTFWILISLSIVSFATLCGSIWGNHKIHEATQDFSTTTFKIAEHLRHIQQMSKRYNEALLVST